MGATGYHSCRAVKTSPTPHQPAAPTQGSPVFGSSILSDLPTPYANRLLQNATSVSLTDGMPLFRKGDAGNGCYWLRTGLLKVNIASPEGEKRTLAVLGPGSIVGELAMLDGLPRSADVYAIGDCRLTFVSRAAFAECLQENPALYRDLSTALASRLRQANEEAAAASFLSVKERIARTIMQLAEHLGEKGDGPDIVIRHRISQSDIAAMAGLARESVNRTMTDWRRKGIVDTPSRATMIVHRGKLELELETPDRLGE